MSTFERGDRRTLDFDDETSILFILTDDRMDGTDRDSDPDYWYRLTISELILRLRRANRQIAKMETK